MSRLSVRERLVVAVMVAAGLLLIVVEDLPDDSVDSPRVSRVEPATGPAAPSR